MQVGELPPRLQHHVFHLQHGGSGGGTLPVGATRWRSKFEITYVFRPSCFRMTSRNTKPS